uniref:Uncharacterized protein n=1 Tax=Populus alba TaxID=43335 RepID=A0A4U5P7J9_POPAL|nr:hypothetical protein D5086_0000218390 [Populus alba]
MFKLTAGGEKTNPVFGIVAGIFPLSLFPTLGQETGTAGHANTSISRGVTLANVVGTPGPQVILGVSVGAVAHHLGSPGRMFVPVIGTALPETAGPTTLLAVLVASNVECTRKWTPPGASILIFLDLEGLVGALLEVAIDLDGNPETGFALGGDATNTTLLAEWSASSAMPQEILATELHTRYNFSISWDCRHQPRTKTT